MSKIRSAKESGHILVMSALLMVPLVTFAALAVDVGSWYVSTAKAQRAADAAALAGVPLLAVESDAVAEAMAVAARNGYVDQPGCDSLPCTPTAYPQVVVTRVDLNRLRVDILTETEMILGQVVSDAPIPIHRDATAAHAPQVPLGNPTSALGLGTDPASGGYTANYWLRTMSNCEPRSSGDFIGAGGGCPNTNPNYRPEGHTFIVDVPLNTSYDVQTRLTCAEFDGNQANASMDFTLYPSDDTPYDPDDNRLLPPVAAITVDRPSTAICPVDGSGWNRSYEPAPWVTIATVNTAGRYVLTAKNPAIPIKIRSLYSLRVIPAGDDGSYSTTCSRIGTGGSAGCPNIEAHEYLTSYSHAQMFPGGSIGRAQLYLAKIEDFYAGSTVRIELFDPADGIDAVRIVDPHGDYVPLSWFTVDCSLYGYECGRGDLGSETSKITQTCSGEPCLKQDSGISFQDRTVMMDIVLPHDYTCAEPAGEPADCWWKVEYEDNNLNANESTTWGVEILGDPVHLVE